MEIDAKISKNGYESKSDYISETKLVCSNLKDSFSGELNAINSSTEEILQKPDVGRSIFQHRYLVALLGFSVFCQLNVYRIATTISLIAMVNTSAISYETNSSLNIASCVSNSSSQEKYAESEISGEFNWSPETQSYILSSSFLGYLVTQIPAGMFAEIYGGKIALISGLFLSSIGHILSPLAAYHSSHLMIVMQFIRGTGQGVLFAAYSVIGSNWFPSIERGFYNSVMFSGTIVGAVIIAFSAGAMCTSSILGGWSSVYYLYGGLGLLQCVIIQVLLYESPKVHPGITETEKNYILHYQEADLHKKRPPKPWRSISTSVPFYALNYAMFGAYWATSHLFSIHSIYLTTMLHFTLEENGFFVSLTFVFQIVISFITNFATVWLNRQNLVGVDKLRKGNNFLACLGYSLGLMGMYFLGCDRTMSNIVAIIGMSFNGFVYGGCLIVPNDMSPTFAGTLMGVSSCIGSSGAFILLLIYGVMIEEEQSLEQWNKIYFISISIVLSSGIIFCLFGSAEIQPWNYASEDRTKSDSSNGTTDVKKSKGANNTIDAATYF